MTYSDALPKLERLLFLVEKTNRHEQLGTPTEDERRELPLLYGELEEIISSFVGNQNVSVPGHIATTKTVYPNYIAAGYLSDWG